MGGFGCWEQSVYPGNIADSQLQRVCTYCSQQQARTKSRHTATAVLDLVTFGTLAQSSLTTQPSPVLLNERSYNNLRNRQAIQDKHYTPLTLLMLMPSFFFFSQVRRDTSSGGGEESSPKSFHMSAREYVESLHQNSKLTLLYGKNNVLVQPVSSHLYLFVCVCVEVTLSSVEYVFVCVFVSVSACVAPLSGECMCVCVCVYLFW
jgi:hypothetical protein